MDKENYKGKIRCFLHKTDENEHEELSITVFDDYLISGVNSWEYDYEILRLEIDNVGLYEFEDDIEDILKSYEVDDYVEIVADAYIKYMGSGSDIEVDMWLENIKHRKLTEYQISRFIKVESNEKFEICLKLAREICDTTLDPEYPLDILVEKLEKLSERLKEIGY